MSVTIQELNDLAGKIAELRDKEKAAKLVVQEIANECEALERRAIDILVENQMTSYYAPVGRMTVNRKTQVAMPKTPEDWASFWAGLEAIGEKELLMTVNSMKLNSWYKEKDQLATEQGEEFKFPGLTGVTEKTHLSLTRG